MPTLDLKVQEIGPSLTTDGQILPSYTSIVGANEPHKAVNESASTGHDGDTSYLLMDTQIVSGVQFYMFKGSEHWEVGSLTLRAYVKGNGANNITVRLYLSRGTDTETGDLQQLGSDSTGTFADYTAVTGTTTVDPFTGAAFNAASLRDYLAAVAIVNLSGVAPRISLVSGQVTYTQPTNWSSP
jgi:hypothetical protein